MSPAPSGDGRRPWSRRTGADEVYGGSCGCSPGGGGGGASDATSSTTNGPESVGRAGRDSTPLALLEDRDLLGVHAGWLSSCTHHCAVSTARAIRRSCLGAHRERPNRRATIRDRGRSG